MNHRNTDSETDAEWEALKHKMYTQEAIVPLLKKSKPGIWKIARIAAEYYNYVQQEIRLKNFLYAVCCFSSSAKISGNFKDMVCR